MRNIPGNTKLIKIEKINCFGNNIFVKDESSNPSGSIKDRTVFGMLTKYKNDGTLIPGCTIIEATSGNTGISLAFYQRDFGYHAIIVMPTSASINRRRLIAKYRGEMILVNGGMKECNAKAQQLQKQIKDSFIFNQFDCLYNKESHIATGREIDGQLENIDYIFAGFGTGGTISGIGEYFKSRKECKIIGIEPTESPLITKGEAFPHKIEGIGANFVPKNLNKDVIDEVITVSYEESLLQAKELRDLGFDIGISSGAALKGALNYLNKNKISGKNVVVILPDKGDRYLW